LRKLKLMNPITNPVSPDMRLQPNIGSDRSWVWKVVADYSEDPPTSETLAIRFANAECWYPCSSLLFRILMTYHRFPDAGQFKKAFEDARENNTKLSGTGSAASHPPATEKPEETVEDEEEDEDEDEDEPEGNAAAPKTGEE
jgi:Ran-binding protein 1